MAFSKLALLLTASATIGALSPAEARPLRARPASDVPAVHTQAETAGWWRAFGDPVLDRIVATVLDQNLDLKAASARITQARAMARYARANMLPSANLSASAQRVSQSLESPIGAAGSALGLPRSFDLYQAGAEASWEIDLFGRLGRERHAALSDLDAATHDAASMRLSLAAEAATAYVDLRRLQASLAIAESQVANAEKAVELVRLKVDQGFVPARALDQALALRDEARAALPGLRAAVAADADRIDVLMGRNAGAARAELAGGVGELAAIPETIDPGTAIVPADLMRRRPDVVAAERRMIAADDRVAVALGEYYPRISLGGLLGVVTLGVSKMFTGDSVQAAGGASLRWRLFDFSRVDSEVALARGRHAEALARYRGALVQATADVETALTGLGEARVALATRQQQVEALTAARDRINAAYRKGDVALLDVLEADQHVLSATQQLALARAQAAQASIFAVRALGGGFEQRDNDHG